MRVLREFKALPLKVCDALTPFGGKIKKYTFTKYRLTP